MCHMTCQGLLLSDTDMSRVDITCESRNGGNGDTEESASSMARLWCALCVNFYDCE